MKSRARRGLAIRFLSSILGVTLVVMALSMTVLHFAVSHSTQHQTEIAERALSHEQEQSERLQSQALKTKAEILGLFMARTAADVLLTFDMDLLARYQQVAATDDDIEYAIYLNPEGKPMLAQQTGGEGILESRYAVQADGELLGYVLVGLNTRKMQQATQVASQRIAAAIEHARREGAKAQVYFIYILAFAALTMMLVMGLLFHVMFRRLVLRPLNRANQIARGIADGELDQRVEIAGEDEIGQLGASLSVMITNLKRYLEQARHRADEASRIRMALDVCSTNVIVADQERRVIYVNHSSASTMQRIGGALRQALPEFAPNDFLHSDLALFHTDQATRRGALSELRQACTEDLLIGDCSVRQTSTPVFNDAGERLGTAVEWIDRTEEVARQAAEQRRLEEEACIAAENLRIRVALDNVSSSVMMADNQRRILYLNQAAEDLFSAAEQDIRADLPGFDARALVGASIDRFHRDPQHQAELLQALDQPYRSEITLGRRTLRVVANPVISAAGERLGTAVEWTERSEEVAVEREVEMIVDAARDGDLSRRIEMAKKTGFFKTLGVGINALIEQLSSIFTDMAEVMGAMAQGDLSRPLQGEYRGSFDALKNNVNGTLDNLKDIIIGLRESMDDMRVVAEDISSGNTNLSARTEHQASNLEQTASSVAQLAATVRNNADNAQNANQLATDARGKAEQGGKVVSDAVRAMQAINASSHQIAEIIGVIDEIAFQTNLLALNASVEAARAGDQGRGFAVVATEVRNLAGRSAAAAKQIKELIKDSGEKVKLGTQLVNDSGATLEEIVEAVKKVGDIIAAIAAASAEQSAGIDQVNQSVTAMDEMTQQNAALAQQTSSASASMSEKALQLNQLIARFTL
jgi:methyl-accepting chemotaxis protein